MGWKACAMISCRVVDSIELGSHTMFIAEVEDAKPVNTFTKEASFLKISHVLCADTVQMTLNRFMNNLKYNY